SGPRYIKTNWSLQASTQKTNYNNLQSVDQTSESASVGYQIEPTVRLTATGGYEKNTYFTVGDKPEGSFYNAGFTWTPSSRTSVSATIGHRYFGQTYFLAANHRARNTVFSINYNEDITSSQGQFEAVGLIDT
ncbi:TIGR03016 family PEP-CTERM system-associated outer membrane protein, partial [Escherichia coli]|nr:TIGR03016 family PEP-CTERM system-associated outer membrane protein [Escherichia coli]